MGNTNRADVDHYQTLGIARGATPDEVKQAYRKLAKQFHPDAQNPGVDKSGTQKSGSQGNASAHDKIAQVNAAYEVLGDANERRQYDQQRRLTAEAEANDRSSRAASAARAGAQYRKKRSASVSQTSIEQWLRSVYNPTDRLIGKIIKPLKAEVKALSADPFDDELMEVFTTYLEGCRASLEKAQAKFKSMPNPAAVARGAANLYYCLNQLEDGLEEIERFTYTYDDSYLHTGQELFRISAGLRKEAKADIRAVL
ncbi:MAG: DnaJ domain-containing protein [Cyanobacteria bacterium J06598_3]